MRAGRRACKCARGGKRLARARTRARTRACTCAYTYAVTCPANRARENQRREHRTCRHPFGSVCTRCAEKCGIKSNTLAIANDQGGFHRPCRPRRRRRDARFYRAASLRARRTNVGRRRRGRSLKRDIEKCESPKTRERLFAFWPFSSFDRASIELGSLLPLRNFGVISETSR